MLSTATVSVSSQPTWPAELAADIATAKERYKHTDTDTKVSFALYACVGN